VTLALGLLLGLAALAFVVVPLLGEERSPEAPPPPEGKAEQLRARREALYESVRDLDFEHAMGKIGDADHQATRGELMREAAAVLRELDREPAAGHAPGSAAAACPSCGEKSPPGARFCDACGTAFGPRCPACGAANRPRARFCNGCGGKL
jgi:hypothetical protein